MILLEGMDNGLINFYDNVQITGWPPYYLYFWYFLFFPIYIIPAPFNLIIGIYIWDGLRLLLSIYVLKGASNIFKNKNDLFIFYLFGTVGYALDAYFNNVNFLIVFFVFYSYVFLQMDKKWIAGILFTLAIFKINALLYLPVILIIQKIKWKDLIYYLTPIVVVCLPYLIFPDYLLQMLRNWFSSDSQVSNILFFDSIMWKFLQPSHLMFIGLIFLIFIENTKNEKRRYWYRIILVSLISIYCTYLTIVVNFL